MHKGWENEDNTFLELPMLNIFWGAILQNCKIRGFFFWIADFWEVPNNIQELWYLGEVSEQDRVS